MDPLNASPYRSEASRTGLLMLVALVYVANLLDRQLVSMLATDIKGSLHISDANIGFLLGTSFAVFYAIFGIPLGKAADLLSRTRIVASGVAAWSLLTSLSGFARSFTFLAACRMGVGVGEASASPAIYSMIFDVFPPHRRTTAIAVYSSGIYIGSGLGLALGGVILAAWKQAFPDPALAPLGLKAWQAAFLIVGAPGLVLALIVGLLPEPARVGASESRLPPVAKALRIVGLEILTMLPVTGLLILAKRRGWRAGAYNLAAAAGITAVVAGLAALTSQFLQWLVLGYGWYAFLTWAQILRGADPAAAAVLRDKPLVLGFLGYGCCCFLTVGPMAWLASYFQRSLGVPAAEVGPVLGVSYAAAGLLGTVLGGLITDRFVKRFGDRARLLVSVVAIVLATAFLAACLLSSNRWLAYGLTAAFNFFCAMWLAPAAANVNSLVPAPMRATASAVYIVTQIFLGTALAPFAIGALSDALTVMGLSAALALRGAMLISLVMVLPAAGCLLAAWRASSRPTEPMTGRFARPDASDLDERAHSAGQS